MSELFLVSLVWGICETLISWIVVGSGISWIRVSLTIVGEGLVRLPGVIGLFFFCLHLFWIVMVFFLSGWLATVYDLGPSWEDMDCSREILFYSCVPVHSGTNVKLNVSNFLCGVSEPHTIQHIVLQIVHVFLLCFQRNVEKGYKSVILCWWWEFIVRFEINCYIAWNDQAFCAEGLR